MTAASPKKQERGNKQDVAAIALSTVCALHCAMIPVVISLLPASLLWLESEWAHRFFVLLALPVSGFAIVKSLLQGTARRFAIGASIGLVLLGAPAMFESLHTYETLLTLSGAVLLAAAHVYRLSGRVLVAQSRS